MFLNFEFFCFSSSSEIFIHLPKKKRGSVKALAVIQRTRAGHTVQNADELEEHSGRDVKNENGFVLI